MNSFMMMPNEFQSVTVVTSGKHGLQRSRLNLPSIIINSEHLDGEGLLEVYMSGKSREGRAHSKSWKSHRSYHHSHTSNNENTQTVCNIAMV